MTDYPFCQTHGDLDAGDFVLEALGQRWAGELCQSNYLSTGYFVGGEQASSPRWLYYRCRTEGQNTILMENQNQNPDISPATNYDTTGEEQSSLTYAAGSSSATYFWSDLSAGYNKWVLIKCAYLLRRECKAKCFGITVPSVAA